MLCTLYKEALNRPICRERFFFDSLSKFELVTIFLLHRIQEPFHAIRWICNNTVKRLFVKPLVAYIHRVYMTQRVLKDDARVLTAINDCGNFCNLAQCLAFLYSVNLSLGVMLYELGQEMASSTSIIQHLHLVSIRELR